MTAKEDLIEQLMENYEKPEDILGENGLIKELTKALLEKALEGEMTNHLGYSKHSKNNKTNNKRNGKSKKNLKTEMGEIPIEIPRDRYSEFEPQIIKKNQTRFDGFDDKIISLYSRGMTTREIQGHIKDMYSIDVSPDFISNVTDSVLGAVKDWQNRSLDPLYPIVYFDALIVKIKDQGHIVNKAVYLAIGVNMEGLKDVLGIWIERTEGTAEGAATLELSLKIAGTNPEALQRSVHAQGPAKKG